MRYDPLPSIVHALLSSPASVRVPIGRTAVVLFLTAAFVVACASGPPVAITPGAFEPLADHEGFLVVQVDTDVAVEVLRMDDFVVARELQPGQHLWLVRMKEGRHRWTAVRLLPQRPGDDPIRLEAEGVLNEQEFDFDLKAGAVNYPGEIVIRLEAPEYGIGSGVTVRNRNHSAIAVRKLLKSHPALLAAHPIRYAGSSGDEFLQVYTRERDRLAGAGEREVTKQK